MDLGGGTGDMPAPQNLQKGLFGAAVVLQWCCGAAASLPNIHKKKSPNIDNNPCPGSKRYHCRYNKIAYYFM